MKIRQIKKCLFDVYILKAKTFTNIYLERIIGLKYVLLYIILNIISL